MTTSKRTKAKHRRANNPALRLTLIEHLLELRQRLLWIVLSILAWSTIAYLLEHSIVGLLLRPAHGEQFIYTSPGGGIDFLFKVCLYTGIVFTIPVAAYHLLRFVQPLIGRHSTRFIVLTSLTSTLLGIAGVLFGYLLGLPAALDFLLHQFHTDEITPLITIQSYLSFVVVYLVGSSLLFQVPLVIFVINRIKPIKLRTLLRAERWVIVLSLIAAAIINPSPRISDMALVAVPMIVSYQVGIAAVWYVNRSRYTSAADAAPIPETAA